MITQIDDYLAKGCGRCARFATADCSVQRWHAGVLALRAICLGEGLVETVKWGHPVYMHAGRNVAIIGAFRGDFRITFMHSALLADPDGVLERQGPNTAHPDAIRFDDAGLVAAKASTIAGFLRQAMGFAAKGTKPAKVAGDLILPEELLQALDDDARLAEAWAVLTPGRQRSHVLMIAGGKATATREARVVKLAPRILAGKGANEY
ncbi:MAG: YdeI/OmpD-associated family protein [Paracoccaceae bacterium]